MVLTNSRFVVVLKTLFFLRTLLANQRNRWQMTNCMKNVVYIGLQNIKNNGVSDLLEKESTRLVARSLAPQARKLQSIDELFLGTKRGFKRLYEGGFKCFQIKR